MNLRPLRMGPRLEAYHCPTMPKVASCFGQSTCSCIPALRRTSSMVKAPTQAIQAVRGGKLGGDSGLGWDLRMTVCQARTQTSRFKKHKRRSTILAVSHRTTSRMLHQVCSARKPSVQHPTQRPKEGHLDRTMITRRSQRLQDPLSHCERSSALKPCESRIKPPENQSTQLLD